MSAETVSNTKFEFVLVEDTYLANFASTPDPTAFAEYLSSSSTCDNNDGNNNDNHVNNDNNNNKQYNNPPAGCVFTNLGGDATLVAPKDWSSSSHSSLSSSSSSSSSSSLCYGHLANFVRGASDEQIVRLWRKVAETLKEKLLPTTTTPSSSSSTKQPIWFSTAGTGIAWLHFRFDSRPKYYLYQPFKEFSNIIV